MHRPTDPTASPIRARIHERALSRVTKLFNAGLGDIFAELFQNARRAGAGRIDVTVERIPSQFEGDRLVTVIDDGAGIADPAVLLSFGESGWDAGTAEREDAAGMGLLSLARRGCVVRSRVRCEATQPGWRLLLTPDHFLGSRRRPGRTRRRRPVSPRHRHCVRRARDRRGDPGGCRRRRALTRPSP